ncbi:hypothetical protein L211DRAFT_841513 [Terfezia boudieri ATCC MYA-4762]|uniref:Uncharacterized protein n=1 Tax=Terfezia boudieri ATCC MYA-4762 TaxID=1051890 RepID=A0A3N4LCI2_9PEZI|nr:hypothetical protein L211DRAFT_841513 [Terfezia boudieri ATCC MYA-4762]
MVEEYSEGSRAEKVAAVPTSSKSRSLCHGHGCINARYGGGVVIITGSDRWNYVVRAAPRL